MAGKDKIVYEKPIRWGIPPRQVLFMYKYLESGNASKAYRKVYGNSKGASVSAHKLIRGK